MTHQHKFNLRKRQPKQQTAPTSGSKNNSAANDTASGSTQRKTSGVNDQLDPGWLSEQPNTTKKNNKGKGKQLFRAENGQTESISEQAIKNLEEKVDTVISYLRQYEERIVTLEKSPHHSTSIGGRILSQSDPRHIIKSNAFETNSEEQDLDTDNLIDQLRRRNREDNSGENNKDNLNLVVTQDDLNAIGRSTRQPEEFNFTDQTAGIAIENIKDALAKVVEKRRLTFIRNWSIIWPQLQQITNKPALTDKTWKRLAFGQFTELSDFLTQDIRNITTDEDDTLKTAEGGTISLAKEKKQRIYNLSQWLQAWSKYTKAALIICAARQDELAYHQEAVISHCGAFPFETVQNWDRARRFFITEARDQTLLISNYDLDTKYLTHGAYKYQSASGRNSSSPSNTRTQTCKLFNWTTRCIYGDSCIYKHQCEACGSGHPAKTCNDKSRGERRYRDDNQPGAAGKRPRIKKEEENGGR